MHSRRDVLLEPNLAFYLPLFELDGSSLISSSAYGHASTVGGPLWRPDGRSFNGLNDKIVTPASSAFDIRNSLTLMAWARSDDITLGQIIMQRGSMGLRRYFIDFLASNARLGVANSDGTVLSHLRHL